jgi:hypothetical protein
VKRAAPALLLLLGLLQMGGDLLKRTGSATVGAALMAIGAATGASPAPRVFSSVHGLETYSTRFTLEWTDRAGAPRRLPITREVYGRIRGPYMRRNVYGAALAYGPVLATMPRTASMFRAVVAQAFWGEASLLREIGVDPEDITGPVRILYTPRPGADMDDLPRVITVPRR